MKTKFKKQLAGLLLLIIVSSQLFTPLALYAEEIASTNVTPTPTESTQQDHTTQEQTQVQVAAVESPTVSPSPTEEPRRENESSRRRAEREAQEAAEKAAREALKASQTESTTTTTSPTPTPQSSTGQQSGNDQMEKSEIKTGDATTEGALLNDVNSNISTKSTAGSGATVTNKNNGAGSTNTGSASITNNSTKNQTNNAALNNDVNLGAETGNNSASRNHGGSEISTGDANVSGTIVNSVNTNVDGVAVAEFNIVDDHQGDIVLDFGDINCTVNCGGGETAVINANNGENSTNTGEIAVVNQDNTFQYNDADVDNNMTLTAITGGNKANDNIGGDNSITTGDANLAANVMNFVNNNIAGNVVLGVVNIFGDLVGDIILPENPFANCSSCFANNTTVANSGNGAGSTNTANVEVYDTDNTFQYNDADIENNIIVDANTGKNSTSDNIGGDNSIKTGDTDVNVGVLNIANSNIIGGNWWLVIVNEAGNWIGKIMGAPEGANFAGSQNTEFRIGENGEVIAVNNGNKADSENTSTVTTTNTNTTTQINNANITNNINLTADTGNNSANRNGGGDTSIKTGDINAVANIVNFVNNNIAGDGRLFVTMINVFGNWMGDVVTPGNKKDEVKNEDKGTANIGGAKSESKNNTASTQKGSNNTQSSSTSVHESSDENVELVADGEGENFYKGNFGTVQGEKDSQVKKDATVASIVGQDDSAAVADKTLRINLAWVLLAIPAAGFFLIIKKTIVPVKTLALRGINLFL